MKARVKTFTAVAVSLLSACSTQPAQRQDTAAIQSAAKPALPQEKPAENYEASTNPPLTTTKDGKTLNLVRIMDGGICKNELQGASGSFLVYADPQDLERIKREKPKEIFKDFETKIQKLASEALEKAIDQTNLAVDPFSLGDDVAQEKLAAQLTKNFSSAASGPVAAFDQETTLTIDVTPFPPSLLFYQKGCDANRFEP
ncbi:hypothetical protein [Methylomicrobium lacus]|uniref:hypothetical protein n=1 Tax=Methylomicrobium lacus TaxID=136992 RepID=UPI0035A9742D